MTDAHDGSTAMVTALVRLRGALQETTLPLELPGAAEQRAARLEMVDQLEDYVIPRLMTLDAPLLAVVGGSTGAGKSTLVNSLVGRRVTTPGVLRPTTRSLPPRSGHLATAQGTTTFFLLRLPLIVSPFSHSRSESFDRGHRRPTCCRRAKIPPLSHRQHARRA